MDTYNHFAYGEMLAAKLKPISHSDKNKRFFRSFGIEGLFDLREVLSNVSGMILIAVDGAEEEINYNSDTLKNNPEYAFIIAKDTNSNNAGTIFKTIHECKSVCWQISAKMIQEFLYGGNGLSKISGTFNINGIGPIGDNYYGAMLSFNMKEMFRAVVDNNMWNE